MMKPEKLDLVSEWDKTFPKSKSVNHKKVTFVNRYGITLAADMYTPKNEQKKFPALAVCGPFGAGKTPLTIWCATVNTPPTRSSLQFPVQSILTCMTILR